MMAPVLVSERLKPMLDDEAKRYVEALRRELGSRLSDGELERHEISYRAGMVTIIRLLFDGGRA